MHILHSLSTHPSIIYQSLSFAGSPGAGVFIPWLLAYRRAQFKVLFKTQMCELPTGWYWIHWRSQLWFNPLTRCKMKWTLSERIHTMIKLKVWHAASYFLLSKNTLLYTVALCNMLLHAHEHTRRSLFSSFWHNMHNPAAPNTQKRTKCGWIHSLKQSSKNALFLALLKTWRKCCKCYEYENSVGAPLSKPRLWNADLLFMVSANSTVCVYLLLLSMILEA